MMTIVSAATGILAFFSLILSVFSTKTIYYRFHPDNDQTVNECILNAMDSIMEETCILFDTRTENSILFMQSGQCSWQDSNSTIHMNSECIDDDTCLLILSHVLSIERPPRPSHIARLVNMKYNCTGRCTAQCENGGSINDDCECECGYGFEGERCELLTKRKLFTDPSCGEVPPTQSVISLSSYPEVASGSTLCQWLVRGSPSESVEFEIDELDLDSDNMLPGQKCNDLFYIWGSTQISNPVHCDPKSVQTLKGQKYKSDSNWLLIELRMNPWSERPHKGPFIKYRLVDSSIPHPLRAFSAEVSSLGANQNYSFVISICIITIFTLCLLHM